MTIYRINNRFIFNEETKEIKKIRSKEKIKLTFMRAHCLSYIIQHAQDEVIEKVAISEELWGTRSKFTSDASLTQTLYLIRRDLKTLGMDEFFFTVPRVGIRVNGDTQIEKIIVRKYNVHNRIAFFSGLLIFLTILITAAFYA